MGQIKNKENWIQEDRYRSVLERVTEVLNKHNINYFLAFGTLLGFIREGKRIPWDNDLDIAIDDNDFDKVISLTEDFRLKGFTVCLKTGETHRQPRLVLLDENASFHIDLYRFIQEKDYYSYTFTAVTKFPAVFAHKVFELYVTLKHGKEEQSRYQIDELNTNFLFKIIRGVFRAINKNFGTPRKLLIKKEDTVDVLFYGIPVKIPKNWIDYLKLSYGKYWATPLPDRKNADGGAEYIKHIENGVEVCYL
jgi:phosphorylcholine metabolism protein LicD